MPAAAVPNASLPPQAAAVKVQGEQQHLVHSSAWAMATRRRREAKRQEEEDDEEEANGLCSSNDAMLVWVEMNGDELQKYKPGHVVYC